MAKKFKVFETIYNAYTYANTHGINPKDKTTWDINYKRRMARLAGLKKEIEDDFNFLTELL